ncbi:hypothetical protein [Methanobrevibacter sp.]|uniref:hypothetical protein n=1 Tax=Methanobrevibacter sp. TaxID=66852 RepID=UPI00388F5797
MSEKDTKEFRFGSEKFGGRYKPGEIRLNLPDELSHEDFENMFTERIESLYKIGREFIPFDEGDVENKKEKLKPLSIRVKAHTKEFFKNNSLLSAREVLELYENYNHGSEAFINSLLKEEKELEHEMAEIQEKLHNARLFKDKLQDMQLNAENLSDEEVLAILEKEYEDSQIKVLFDESAEKILDDVQLYNTKSIALKDSHLEIIAANDSIPVVYYFSSELAEDDLIKALSEVKSYAKENEIEFVEEDGE